MIDYIFLFFIIWVAWELTSIPSPVCGGLRLKAEDGQIVGEWRKGPVARWFDE